MIDTDRYEGHIPAPWGIDLGEEDGDIMNNDTVIYRGRDMDWIIAEHVERRNLYLIADAPLLLEEVKRLRQVMIYVEQRQPHPALEWALKEGLTLTEIKERIE